MISFNRIKAVFIKDMAWAKGNSKLLVIMLMPLFFIFFFSKVDPAIGPTFSISFTAAFIGVLSTSQLFIEEKKAGTLQNLLISPLQSSELIISKFLFSTSLILLFDFLALSLNQRINLLFDPLFLISLLAYSGFTVFFGCFLGLFFESEKEISVISPFVMLFFIGGNIASKVIMDSNYGALFPEYHITELINLLDVLSFKEKLFHLIFNLLYMAITFILTVQYTIYYFSPKRTGKFTASLFIALTLLVGSLFSSYKIKSIFFNDTQPTNKSIHLKEMNFSISQWRGKIQYNPKKWSLNKSLNNSERLLIEIVNIKDSQKVYMTIRNKNISQKYQQKSEELNFQLLGKKKIVANDREYTVKTEATKTRIFLYSQPMECGDFRLNFKSTVQETTAITIFKTSRLFEEVIQSSSIQCKQEIK